MFKAPNLTLRRKPLSGLKMLATALAATTFVASAPIVAPTIASAEGVVKLRASQANQRIKVGFNKSVVIDLPADAYDILVANPAVADAITRTSRRIYVFGKQIGETNVFVFGEDGSQIASLDLVIERDVAGLEAHIEKFIAGSEIKVELINDNVVLTGTVQTPLDSARAVQLAEIFVTGGEATTGNFSTTAGGGSQGGDVDINNPDSERRTSSIVNLLTVAGEDQVTLKVTVAEVQRSVLKQLGFSGTLQGNDTTFSVRNSGVLNTEPLNSLASSFDIGGAQISSTLRALETQGVMRTLAEPNLTAVSGEQATFRAGGEMPFVTGCSTEPGTNRLTYETERLDFGIGLEFLPVVLSPGRISLKVRTSVSEPTTVNGFNICGLIVQSMKKRLADTTVEIPSGGTMMIAGLIQDDIKTAVTAFPGLGTLPVLGSLFRSRDFQRSETELVILVTPYIARPTARNELARPDDNFTPSSDGAGIFLNKVNRVYGSAKTKLPNGRYHGVVGFIYK
jgi:pilus assembly protein CpaC